MSHLLHELILHSAARSPSASALNYQQQTLTYEQLATLVETVASAFVVHGLQRSERVAIYLEKRIEMVTASFAAAAAGGVFVPINPLLKPEQVAYILNDCNVRILITSAARHRLLVSTLAEIGRAHV